MPKKRVKKEKTSKRGKGDVKQSVKVSVRIGDVKPKRKRQYNRKPKGEGGLARPEETRTLYGNLPPPPPQQVILTPQIPTAFQPQPKVSGLLEDVKKERTNLLEDIKREISSQISKSQGAEQRGELAKAGAFDPFNQREYKQPQITFPEQVDIVQPSMTEIKQSKPIITELSSTKYVRKPREILEDSEEEEDIPIPAPKKETKAISEVKVQEQMKETSTRLPENIMEKAVMTAEERQKKQEQAKARRADEGRDKIYTTILAQYGFPAIRGDMPEEDFKRQIYTLFKTANSGGKKRVSKSNIQDYYGMKFGTIEKSAGRQSGIPTRDIEAQPIPTTTAQAYNLLPVVEAQPISSSSTEAVKMV